MRNGRDVMSLVWLFVLKGRDIEKIEELNEQ